jgi:hypothetical protein
MAPRSHWQLDHNPLRELEELKNIGGCLPSSFSNLTSLSNTNQEESTTMQMLYPDNAMKVLLKPKPGGMIYTTFAKLLLLQVQP